MKLTKKNYILTAASVLIVGAFALGGYLWSSQVKELKNNRTLQEQRIQELENKLKDKNGAINDDNSPNWVKNPLFIPTDQDVVEINKVLNSLCAEKDAKEVTSQSLQESDSSGNSRFYKGYAKVSVSCKSEPGGYISYMQRQADMSWKHLFGAQDTPSCETINKYMVPYTLEPKCVNEAGSSENNTN